MAFAPLHRQSSCKGQRSRQEAEVDEELEGQSQRVRRLDVGRCCILPVPMVQVEENSRWTFLFVEEPIAPASLCQCQCPLTRD